MEERVSLVAEEWRENYEEMILEKVELEQKIQKLEKDQLLELMMAQDQVLVPLDMKGCICHF